jgi:hypothetical protein
MLNVRTSKIENKVDYREDNSDPKSKILATFTVACQTPTEINKMLTSKSNQKTVWDSPDKKQKKERFQEPDYIAIAHERVCKVILGWTGLQDEKTKKPLECNDKNKILFYEHNQEIADYVLEEADKLGLLAHEEKEKEQGNLGKSQDGN